MSPRDHIYFWNTVFLINRQNPMNKLTKLNKYIVEYTDRVDEYTRHT